MTKQTKQIKSKEPPHEQEQQFSEVMALTEIENLDKLLASPRSVALIHALAEFSEIDYQSEQQGPKAGEFFDRVLQMPLDVQKKLVWAIADRRGLPRPNYEHEGPGRPTTGQKQLSEAVYGSHPDMLIKGEGMKDTKASKRITDHRSRYLKAIKRLQHQAEPGEPTGEDKPTAEISTHALKVTFQALWGVAEIEDQRRTLVDLYMKVGVTAETLLKWSNGELLGLATSALSKGAIDVPHRAVS